MDLETFLVLDCSAQDLRVGKSKILPADFRSRLLKAQGSGNAERLRQCYRLLIYADLTRELRGTFTYRGRVMREALKTFRNMPIYLPEDVTDKHGVEHKTWIVAAPLYIIW